MRIFVTLSAALFALVWPVFLVILRNFSDL